MKNALLKYFLLFQFILAMSFTMKGQVVPQGFKYQTTVRDASGLVLGNQLVKLRFSFYSGSASGTLQWQETQTVTTDSYGAVVVVIGTGVSTGLGVAPSFNLVNWSSNAYYLKIAVDDTGGSSFTDIGSSQLFSVPYAFFSLNAGTSNALSLSQFADVDLTGLATGKLLKWNGLKWSPSLDNHSDTVSFAYSSSHSNYSDTANNVFVSGSVDSVLFAYQTNSVPVALSTVNATNTNSAVHADTALYALNSNISAWQRNGNAAASSKYVGTTDLKDVVVKSNGTERLRVKTNGNVLLRNATNSASMSLLGNDGLYSIGTLGLGTLASAGAGTKLFWLPTKAAFRSGYVNSNQWDTANVGQYSVAFGRNTIAGKSSFTSGDGSASGDYCIAMGRKSKATALGAYPGGNGIALGDSSVCTSSRSVVIGKGNYVDIGAAAVAIGYENKVIGAQSLALGSYNQASGNWSSVIGYHGSSNAKNGSFVYSDASSSATFNSTVAHQFIVRANGGVIFYSDSARTMGITLASGSGSWASVSDKNKKENFAQLNNEEILSKINSLKIKSWNYKSQKNAIRHIGPMAQDFYAAFGLGENAITISGIDMDGVILKGIQGVNERVNALNVLNTIDELKNKVNTLDDTAEMNKRLDLIEAALD